MKPPTFILYHSPCPDGWAAAVVAHMALGSDGVTYVPVNYDSPPPVIPEGARVYVLDFSWPDTEPAREALERLAAVCEVTVLDHHKTAREALRGLAFATFAEAKCGAVMAWEHFRGQGEVLGPVPRVLEYVQDRDLGLMFRDEGIADSRVVYAGLALVPRTF